MFDVSLSNICSLGHFLVSSFQADKMVSSLSILKPICTLKCASEYIWAENAVTQFWFIFDQHCLDWQFYRFFMRLYNQSVQRNKDFSNLMTPLCQSSYQTRPRVNEWLWLARQNPGWREICLNRSFAKRICQSKWNMSLQMRPVPRLENQQRKMQSNVLFHPLQFCKY